MLKEQSIDSLNWFLFDDRNIINDQLVDGKYPNDPHRTIVDQLKRPADYCNLPLAKFYENENGLGKDWKLKKIFLFIRHGQRSSADPMTNTDYQYHINCSLKQFPLFKIQDWKRFIDTLKKPSSTFTTFETFEKCSENQMTLFGILQMFIIGTKLKTAYEDFLDTNTVRLFSTSYQRSILSGEIIQYLLAKDVPGYQHSEIEESQSLIFCRPSADVPCQCSSLRYHFAKYNRYLNNLVNTNTKCLLLVNYFNSILVLNKTEFQGQGLSLSPLFDIVSSALCASNLEEISKANQFCWPFKGDTIAQEHYGFLSKNGDVDEKDATTQNKPGDKHSNSSNRCFSLQKILSLWQCFDEQTAILNGNLDFKRYAKLAAFPILNEIIVKMKDIQVKEQEPNDKSNFVIYIGHDHSIRLLLGALNFKEIIDPNVKHVLNTWPGYASRVTLEVFDNVNKSGAAIPKQIFRLLYNGLDLTSSLQFCELGSVGCDFNLLAEYISGVGYWNKDLFDTTSYKKECKIV